MVDRLTNIFTKFSIKLLLFYYRSWSHVIRARICNFPHEFEIFAHWTTTTTTTTTRRRRRKKPVFTNIPPYEKYLIIVFPFKTKKEYYIHSGRQSVCLSNTNFPWTLLFHQTRTIFEKETNEYTIEQIGISLAGFELNTYYWLRFAGAHSGRIHRVAFGAWVTLTFLKKSKNLELFNNTHNENREHLVFNCFEPPQATTGWVRPYEYKTWLKPPNTPPNLQLLTARQFLKSKTRNCKLWNEKKRL